jgi:hypothetical protein
MSMNNGNKYFREALKRIEAKSDRNTGGALLGKKMVHKNDKAYDRRKLRLNDRRGEY